MSRTSFREFAKWPSLISAAIALGIIVFVRTIDVFASGNTAGMLVLLATILAVFALVFGVAGLPRWPAVLALLVLVYVAYCLLFVSMYSVA
jgi:hypothetical protein